MSSSPSVGFFLGDTFANSVELFSNIMQSITLYFMQGSDIVLPCCMDLLKTLIEHITRVENPIKTLLNVLNKRTLELQFVVVFYYYLG